MKNPVRLVLASLALGSACADLAAAEAPRAAALEAWRADRFGLFIHWGPVSLKGTEIGWSRAGERRGYRGPGTLVPPSPRPRA